MIDSMGQNIIIGERVSEMNWSGHYNHGWLNIASRQYTIDIKTKARNEDGAILPMPCTIACLTSGNIRVYCEIIRRSIGLEGVGIGSNDLAYCIVVGK